MTREMGDVPDGAMPPANGQVAGGEESRRFWASLFCRAVMVPGSPVSLIGRNNVKTGSQPLDRALPSLSAFFVDVVDGLLAADFDKEGAAEDAAGFYVWMRMRGLWPVLVASGQHGRRHVYCRVPQNQRQEAEAKAKQCGGDVRRTIRPPFVPHRRHAEGVPPARPLLPEDPDEALARITGHRPARRGFGPAVLRAVEDGEVVSASNSERVFRAAMAAVNARWSFEEFELLCWTPGTALAQAVADRVVRRGASATSDWLHGEWQRAQDRVQSAPPIAQGGDATPWALYGRALLQEWPGRTANQLAVYLVLLEIAARAGRLTVTASERQLAQESGLSRATVVRALTKLVERGFIHRGQEAAGPGLGQEWVIDVPPGLDRRQQARPLRGDTERVCWRNRTGLGALGRLVYLLLHTFGPLDAAAVRARLGIQPRTTQRHLRQLADHDLIRPLGDGRWVLGGTTPDQVGRRLPLASKAAEVQVKEYQGHRRNYVRGLLFGGGRAKGAGLGVVRQ